LTALGLAELPGNEPAYRGGGLGQGRRAGQRIGQRQRQRLCAGTGPRCAGTAGPLGQTAQDVGETSTADANHILFMKQEEKLARDVCRRSPGSGRTPRL
jgi:hypothetical protein